MGREKYHHATWAILQQSIFAYRTILWTNVNNDNSISCSVIVCRISSQFINGIVI